jgi:hypothetical protein
LIAEVVARPFLSITLKLSLMALPASEKLDAASPYWVLVVEEKVMVLPESVPGGGPGRRPGLRHRWP